MEEFRPPHPSTTDAMRVKALSLLLTWAETGIGNLDQFLHAVLGRYSGPKGDVLIRPGEAETLKFREWLLVELREIAAGKPRMIETPIIGIALNQGGAPRHEAVDLTALLRYAAIQLITSQWWRIAQCARPQCARVFVKTGRSLYHDARCAAAARQAKYHRIHRDREVLAKLSKLIEKECPHKRRANLHGTKTGYQHRLGPGGSIRCERYGVGAAEFDRSPIEVRFEEARGREIEQKEFKKLMKKFGPGSKGSGPQEKR